MNVFHLFIKYYKEVKKIIPKLFGDLLNVA